MEIAQVYINQLNRKIDTPFDYMIPDHLTDIEVGTRVMVPFGFKNKLIDGIIVHMKNQSDYNNLKYIRDIIYNYPKLDRWQIDMCSWIVYNYHCLFMEAVNCYIPSSLKIKKENKEGKVLYSLSNSEKRLKYYTLSGKYEERNDYLKELKSNAIKQKSIIDILTDQPISYKELKERTDCTSNNLKTLETKGLIIESSLLSIRSPYSYEHSNYPKNNLNKYQKNVFEIYKNSKKPDIFLLHGVTGSGKTEVFLRMIEDTISKGKKCLYLVPEISLTSQVVQRIMGRFKQNVGIIHSQLNTGEKIDQWNSIKNNQYNIVLGARSAIFSPLDNIGLIIMDEEHEITYKSSNRPRYNTLDVAKQMVKIHSCHIVLGSATPSMTSYYLAVNNKYKLLELPYRVNNYPLPDVEIVDMKEELYTGNKSVISNKLYKEINNNLQKREQTILFLNKRGYSTFVFCRNCGYVVKCSKCEISMTYHRDSKNMLCHYCGYTTQIPNKCPKCNSNKIKHTGSGTQKLEILLNKYFPKARILRMDTDSMQKKGAYDRTLEKFVKGEVDILLGTQMVTKGFDFENVTLVGVILADTTLNIPDFKATERTFQLITQVAGRAGRGIKPGKVVVQTYDPDHYSIKLSREHDYLGFYQKEIKYRLQMNYPPYTDIIYIGFTNIKEEMVSKNCCDYYNKLIIYLKENNLDDLCNEIYRPSSSPIKKINNKYRWYFIIKTTHYLLFNKIINKINKYKEVIEMDSIRIIDINPNNII
ncbi:MAG: primosomal protein N' [Eubacteriaceae bacterium]